ncbi:MAG: nucleoside monophosphate kinase [Candidatus Nealsonbacteria bacterium]
MQFPIFKTKIRGLNQKFDMNDPEVRKKYFELKAGKEIAKLRNYFEKGNTFIAYLLGKKNSGKGTYAKMFAEIVDPKSIEHFSIGDMIRNIDQELKDRKKKIELVKFLEKNYRGWTSSREIMAGLEKRSTKNLLPTELILLLVKREIAKRPKKTIFIDGFPRDLDQMNLTLFFRDLVGYRDDPDVFVLIDVPEAVIDERIKYRRVCPKCQTSRSVKLLPTSKVGYDPKKKEFYLNCDNPACTGPRMVPKEGDEKGIAPIKERLQKDGQLLEQAAALYGIPKVFLRNSVPKSVADDYLDDYEITPEYDYEWDGQKVMVKEKRWIVWDDQKRAAYSLMPPPVVVSLIKQMVDVLHL